MFESITIRGKLLYVSIARLEKKWWRTFQGRLSLAVFAEWSRVATTEIIVENWLKDKSDSPLYILTTFRRSAGVHDSVFLRASIVLNAPINDFINKFTQKLRIGKHYPCWRPINSTGVILDTRVHGRLYIQYGNTGRQPAVFTGSVDRRQSTRPVNTGVQNETRVHGPSTRVSF